MTAYHRIKKGIFTFTSPPDLTDGELSAWKRIIAKIVIEETTHPDYPDEIAYSPNYSALTHEEQYAIGVALFPSSEARKLINRKNIKGVMGDQTTSFNVFSAPDIHIDNQAIRQAAMVQSELSTRREILASLHSDKMKGRKKGAKNERTIHIEELVKKHPDKTAKKLQTLATCEDVKKMKLTTFANKVTAARKLL
ncbi:MAG: hypothetical protein ACOH1I_01135 [Gallionellaceae bacterium]